MLDKHFTELCPSLFPPLVLEIEPVDILKAGTVSRLLAQGRHQ